MNYANIVVAHDKDLRLNASDRMQLCPVDIKINRFASNHEINHFYFFFSFTLCWFLCKRASSFIYLSMPYK